LIPSDVSALTKSGVRVLVQPSTMRIYKDSEFRAAGAELVEDVSEANTILGIKEFPKEKLIKDKAYMIFSHTIKAQPYNMPFLDTVSLSFCSDHLRALLGRVCA
jgi:alpha-aminoadipic semialdehyde synthase